MDWYISLIIMITLLFAMFSSGIPVAFAFMTLNFICLYLWAGGIESWFMVVNSAFESLAGLAFLVVPSFVLMGELLFYTGSAWVIIDALDKWIGHVPGRLSILAVMAGVVLATLTGSSIGATVMIGSTLLKEMYKRGYKPEMALGSCAASGGLAILIPPTTLGILGASLTKVSIADFLFAIIIPGLVLATLYIGYIVFRAKTKPAIAPPYERKQIPFSEKVAALRYISPIGIVIFFVLVIIFLGVATPSEASALGVVGVLIVCALFRKLSWGGAKKAILSSAKLTAMLMTICMGSMAFSQIMAYAGATAAMTAWVTALPVPKFVLYLLMVAVLLILGCIIDAVSLMMISVPIFLPIVQAVGFDLVWFTVVLLLGVETALITPPFGLNLFAIKGVSPENTMGEVFKSTFPFAICCTILLLLMYPFPQLATWLPGLMH